MASSAIDISDGLISDLAHILKISGTGARINLDKLPLSSALTQCYLDQSCTEEQAHIWSLSGGEDYELCFTVPEINRGALEMALAHTGSGFTCIGQIRPESEGVRYFKGEQEISVSLQGFDHFNLEGTHE